MAGILSYGRESVRLSLAFPPSELGYLRDIARGSGQPLATKKCGGLLGSSTRASADAGCAGRWWGGTRAGLPSPQEARFGPASERNDMLATPLPVPTYHLHLQVTFGFRISTGVRFA